jgi:hypothetical protein
MTIKSHYTLSIVNFTTGSVRQQHNFLSALSLSLSLLRHLYNLSFVCFIHIRSSAFFDKAYQICREAAKKKDNIRVNSSVFYYHYILKERKGETEFRI